MKAQIQTDATGCASNLFTFTVSNARWIAEASSWRSGAARMRVTRSHLLNSLDNTHAWQAIKQLDDAVIATDRGIAL